LAFDGRTMLARSHPSGVTAMIEAFRERVDAGRRLAHELASYARRSNVVVLALPRGGVPVAFEVAQALAAPLVLGFLKQGTRREARARSAEGASPDETEEPPSARSGR